MATINYNEFSIGLDHRKAATVADANRLRELKNAYITPGKVIRKRPGLVLAATLEAGTKGLVSANGKLNTFYKYGSTITHSDTRFLANVLEHSASAGFPDGNLSKILYGDAFEGSVYLCAEYDDPSQSKFHYFIRSGVDKVTATNCPNTAGVAKQESRMFAVDGDVVRYTSTAATPINPADWDTSTPAGTDAGFLPVGQRARGSSQATALGQYDGNLVVFFADSLQVWAIGADAINDMQYLRGLDGIGCVHPRTPIIFAGDTIFLSKGGFRSISTQTVTDNLYDIDVGSPIDNLVRQEISSTTDAIAEYFSSSNQYWCAHRMANNPGKSRVWVYTFSKSAKVNAWSRYELTLLIDDMVSHNGDLFMRAGDNVYQVDNTDTVFDDNGEAYEMRVEMPFLDCKSPGLDKYFRSMDIVVQGEVDVQFKYDPNDETKMTDPIRLSGDTRVLRSIPLEMTGPSIAPVFTSNSKDLVQIDALSLHYETLGVF